ncbi:MAG TPA: cyclic pyranopterin monophosphate synthase MoaC [Actinomycetota bacterium]|jgi:cyclic pyranopterin phosphate synthase
MARLLLFAAARDAAGCSSASVPAASVGEALKAASERFGPAFERVLGVCSLLVDDQRVARDAVWDVAVGEETEIAVLPPVSGGADVVPPVSGRGEVVPPVSGGGDVEMVDVAGKDETKREAVAGCVLVCEPAVRDALLAGEVDKGNAVAAAEVAGTLAAKRVPELIPMCHPVRTSYVGITCSPAGDDAIEVRATVRGTDRTGFEMEALTAASVAALTLYDFGKGRDPAIRIEGLRLLSKSGGKSGEWRAP